MQNSASFSKLVPFIPKFYCNPAGPALILRSRKASLVPSVERAVYLTVLHRLFMSGSDRAAERWHRDMVVPGAEDIELHSRFRLSKPHG